MRWEISELEHKQTLVEEKVKRLPELKKRVIQKNVEAYVAKLKNSDTSLLREVLLELIHNIVIDNSFLMSCRSSTRRSATVTKWIYTDENDELGIGSAITSIQYSGSLYDPEKKKK